MEVANQPFHKRKEGGVEDVWIFQFISVLSQEKNTFIYELTNNQSHDFAQVSARN